MFKGFNGRVFEGINKELKNAIQRKLDDERITSTNIKNYEDADRTIEEVREARRK